MCKMCWTTIEEDPSPMISPCNCKGTLRYVHAHCLHRWRTASHSIHFYRCMQCGTPYKFSKSMMILATSPSTRAVFTIITYMGTILLISRPIIHLAILPQVTGRSSESLPQRIIWSPARALRLVLDSFVWRRSAESEEWKGLISLPLWAADSKIWSYRLKTGLGGAGMIECCAWKQPKLLITLLVIAMLSLNDSKAIFTAAIRFAIVFLIFMGILRSIYDTAQTVNWLARRLKKIGTSTVLDRSNIL